MGIPITKTISPKEFAAAIGSSESSLKRWLDQGVMPCTKTPGGHRRIEVNEAIKYVRESDLTLVQPQVLGIPTAMGDIQKSQKRQIIDFLQCLKEGNDNHAKQYLVNEFMNGKSLAEIFDGTIKNSLEFLGQIHEEDAESIFLEHRATQICISCINFLSQYLSSSHTEFNAVSCSLEGDIYILPSLGTSVVIMENAGNCINIGPHTPISVIKQTVKNSRMKIDLVCISINDVIDVKQTNQDLISLSNILNALEIELVIGGRSSDKINLSKLKEASHFNNMLQLDEHLKAKFRTSK